MRLWFGSSTAGCKCFRILIYFALWRLSPRGLNNRFFWHNLLATNARRPLKCSKDADFRVIFLNETKIYLFILRPRPKGVIQQNLKPGSIMTSPTRIFKYKIPNFLIKATRLSASLEGLNNSLILSAGALWPNVHLARSCLRRALKGFETYRYEFNLLQILTRKPLLFETLCNLSIGG